MKNQPFRPPEKSLFLLDVRPFTFGWKATTVNARRFYLLTITLILSILITLRRPCQAQSVSTDSVEVHLHDDKWRTAAVKKIQAKAEALFKEAASLETNSGSNMSTADSMNDRYDLADCKGSTAVNKNKLSRMYDTLIHFEGHLQLWDVYRTAAAAGLNTNDLQNYTLISVRYKQHNRQIREEYIEQNGQLIFARQSLFAKQAETKDYTDLNWNCALYFQNGAFVDMTSLGHGRTEDPEWDPQSLVEDYHKRKSQLQQFKK